MLHCFKVKLKADWSYMSYIIRQNNVDKEDLIISWKTWTHMLCLVMNIYKKRAYPTFIQVL